MEYLALYSARCKKCSHLDSEEKIAYDKCHYTKGNTECPAQDMQLAVVGQAKRFAREAKLAREKGNLIREVNILKAVASKSEAFQHKYREWSSK